MNKDTKKLLTRFDNIANEIAREFSLKYYEMEDYTADIQFLTKGTNPAGGESWIKMSFTKIDKNTVHQDLDSSTDMGKSWTPAFRGVYKRK